MKPTPKLQVDEQFEALLALSLDEQKPHSPKPTLEEIIVWYEGRLDTVRANEVKQHIARDPVYYEIWSDLVACERRESIKTKQSEANRKSIWQSLQNSMGAWFKPPQWYFTGAFASAVTAVFIVMGLLPGRGLHTLESEIEAAYQFVPASDSLELSPSWPLTVKHYVKSSPFELDPVKRKKRDRQQAFRTGMHQGLSRMGLNSPYWAAVISKLPTQSAPCLIEKDQSICQTQNRLLELAGQWSVLVYCTCDASTQTEHTLPENFWDEQQHTLALFAESFSEDPSISVFAKFVQPWAATVGEPKSILCNRINHFLKLGL